MSLLLLIYCIFTHTVAIAESAPKLEQKVHDSIKADEIETKVQSKTNIDDSSSEGYLSWSDLAMPNLRSDDKSEEGPGFACYIFDERICKLLGERILCGYNRNEGEYDKNVPIDLGNGCFMRNDRIECGYKLPFNSNNDNLRSKPTKTTISATKISQQVTKDENFTTTKSETGSSIEEQSNPTVLPTEFSVSTILKSTTSKIKTSDHKEPEESVTTSQLIIEQLDTSRKTSNAPAVPSTIIVSVRSNNKLTSPTLTANNTSQSSISFPITSEANRQSNVVELAHSTLDDLANDVLLENDNKTVNTNKGLDTKNVELINK